MTLLLRESDVQELLPIDEAVRLVRESLRHYAELRAENLPRRRIQLERGFLNVMAGSELVSRAAGLKAYSAGRDRARFLSALWDSETGKLLSLIEADWLGRIRTGAASGVATEALAGDGGGILCVIGSGRQAQTQVEAIAAARTLTEVRVYSRNREHAANFARRIAERMGIEVRATDDARSGVDGADIVVTITTSQHPVLEGEWLKVGAHVNAAGSNWANRRELDDRVMQLASVIAVDSLDQARLEAGDLIIPVEQGHLSWEDVRPLGEILAGKLPGRQSPADITVFKSLGIAVEDVAVARYVYDQAVSRGIGEVTSFGDA